MATAAHREAHAWQNFHVPIVHGLGDKRIGTGAEFETRPLGSLWTLTPSAKPKLRGAAFLPSTYCEHDARDHAVQRERGQFVALVGDVDKACHPIGDIEAAIQSFAPGCARWVYSTANACLDNLRWRSVVPLAEPVDFATWRDAQEAMFSLMADHGIQMDGVTERAGQISFLPNVPAAHDDTGEALRGEDGKPLYYQARAIADAPGLALGIGPMAGAIADVRHRRAEDERLRKELQAQAARRRANRPANDGGSIIDAFNRANPLPEMLERCGYVQSRRDDRDWRSPHQQSGSYATRIIGEKWVSLSGSDTAAGLGERHGAGCYGDAFDLFVFHDHAGNRNSALTELHRDRERERPLKSKSCFPPNRDAGDPGWTAPPEEGEYNGAVDADDTAAGHDGAPGWTDETGRGRNSGKRQTQSPLPLEWCGDITPQLTGLWLVKRLLPALGLVLIYGHPGSGKSFLALDIAFHVALGWDWGDRRVKQGLVIYVGAEGLAGLRNRIVAFRQHYGIADDAAVPLGLVPTSIDLQAADADTPRLIALIRDAAKQSGHEPALIIVDTLSKTFGAGKENTDDMATYVANCGRIAQEFECCVMPVHHRPKDAESTEPRGHSSLKGGVDTVILVEAGLTKKATVTKQKDAETGDKTLFTLLPVHLGTDEDGEDVTSCVLQQATVDMNIPADPIARARAKLSDKNKVVLAALGKALEHDGEAVPAEIPDTVINRVARTKVAQIEAWRTRALSGLRTGPDTNPDSDRRTFDRSKVKLQSLGIIGVWEGFAWEM